MKKANESAAIVSSWQKIMAVGCSHGEYLHPQASNLVARFFDRWKPKIRIHLGDAFDFQAFRTGAKGTSDEAHPVEADLDHGRRFLKLFSPTVVCDGNHENRIVTLARHYNTMTATAARSVLDSVRKAQRADKVPLIPYTVHAEGWYQLGDFKFGHGHLFSENFIRDSAERWGNCVVAHAHRGGMAKGRRSDCPTAFCVGTLCDPEKMTYASGRAGTLAWSHGIVWGETDHKTTRLFLAEWPQGESEWRLPV